MGNELVLEGGCLCWNIRYRSERPPVFVSHCHCQRCRRHSGSLFMTHMGLPVDGFSWLKAKPTYWHSTKVFHRGFCSRCGSTIAGLHLEEPDIIVVPVGSLDDAEKVMPDRHIMTESQISWLKIDDDSPRYLRLSPGYEHLDLGV